MRVPGQILPAKRAGFSSREEYCRAAAVVEPGSPELIEATDKNEISVSAAEAIARTTPKEKQAE